MNATRCSKIVPASQLEADLTGTDPLPMYMFYSPNNDNNGTLFSLIFFKIMLSHSLTILLLGHDTSIAYQATYLEEFLVPLLKNERFITGNLVVITWDEGI